MKNILEELYSLIQKEQNKRQGMEMDSAIYRASILKEIELLNVQSKMLSTYNEFLWIKEND